MLATALDGSQQFHAVILVVFVRVTNSIKTGSPAVDHHVQTVKGTQQAVCPSDIKIDWLDDGRPAEDRLRRAASAYEHPEVDLDEVRALPSTAGTPSFSAHQSASGTFSQPAT